MKKGNSFPFFDGKCSTAISRRRNMSMKRSGMRMYRRQRNSYEDIHTLLNLGCATYPFYLLPHFDLREFGIGHAAVRPPKRGRQKHTREQPPGLSWESLMDTGGTLGCCGKGEEKWQSMDSLRPFWGSRSRQVP